MSGGDVSTQRSSSKGHETALLHDVFMCVKMGEMFEKRPCTPSRTSIFVQIKFRPVRLAATIPHPHCRISILSWNEKWIIEMEAGQYKQSFKISQESIPDLERVKKLVTSELLSGALDRFHSMHTDFAKSYSALTSQP
jgi:hypothetical protein